MQQANVGQGVKKRLAWTAVAAQDAADADELLRAKLRVKARVERRKPK